MNAKQLIEAAKRLQKAGVGGAANIEDLNVCVSHILSTVHPDDDEPVTREKMEADGWFYDAGMERWLHPKHALHFTTGPQYRNVLWFGIGSIVRTVKSMGHLRRLVAALGE